jgi:hypothetical protein
MRQSARHEQERREANARADEELRQIEAAAARAKVGKLRDLPESTPLESWIVHTVDPSTRTEALRRIGRLDSRQSEAEAKLARRDERVLRELPFLNLEATPALCQGAQVALLKESQDLKPTVPDPPDFEVVRWRVERYLQAIAWLASHDCDCASAITALKEAVRLFPESKSRADFLAGLQQAGRKP